MAKSLVLAEKPSVGRELARVLGCRQKGNGYIEGSRYVVTWALGHLVTLADPEAYGEQYKRWDLSTLPMLPKKMKLVVIKQTSKQFKVVQSLLKRSDITEIIIATDSGREGELVARWILMKAVCKKPAKRLWISSQTDKAIKEGFSKLLPSCEYDNLFASAQARATADWLVGLNITRALTCKYNAQLSAGRVQTPTLALIVKREEEIKNFKPVRFYRVRADLGELSALYSNDKNESRIFDEARAGEIARLSEMSGKAVAVDVKKQRKTTAPPPAYDLTELQRDANKKYAYSAKETLSAMQSLYERHKVLTYPRTDSRYITDDVASTLHERLRSINFGPYQSVAGSLIKQKSLSTKYIVNNNKVTDHHAIIPTEEYVNMSAFSPEERNIYDLVVRRFLAVLSAPFGYEEVKITFEIGKNRFKAKGKTVINQGFRVLYGNLSDTDDDDDELAEQSLPKINKGDSFNLRKCKVESGETKPPSRYTEATLLTAMENPKLDSKQLRDVMQNTSGLGTPATRADIIEKLFSSFYMERVGKSIAPTSKGIQLISIVPDELRSAVLTANWEQELQMIGRGEAKSATFISKMEAYAAKLVSMTKASDAKYVHDNLTKEKCPDCGKYLLDVKGKKGKMLVCPDRECGYRKSMSVETNARCPNCHKKMELRGEGDKRLFVCICGFRESMAAFEKRRAPSGPSKREVEKYMSNQGEFKNTALADALAKLLEG